MSLTATINLDVQAVNRTALDLSAAQDTVNQLLQLCSLTSGTGANKCDSIFHDQRTLTSSATETHDLFDFGGARDALGNTFANLAIKALVVQVVSGNALTVGAEGTAAAWNSLTGSDTVGVSVPALGALVAIAPGAAGYAVADTSNHLLKITNTASGSTVYNIIVIGASAAS